MLEMSNVSINLKKDVVLIKIDDDAPQRKILSELNKKVKELKKMYQDEKKPKARKNTFGRSGF